MNEQEQSVSEKFKEKKPFTRDKKALIAMIIFASVLIPILYIFYVNSLPIDLPDNIERIYITCDEEIEKVDFVDCIVDADGEEINGSIKIRGRRAAEQDKVGYRIELSKRISLFNMRRDDDWQLLAMYYDPSCLRIKLSMDIWRMLIETNPTALLPESEYVFLFINDEFQGLYLFAEKQDRRLYGLDETTGDNKSSLVFQCQAGPVSFDTYESDDWDQDYPNSDEYCSMDVILPDLFAFISTSDNSTFFNETTGIYSKFYKDNLVDFYVFNFFILHEDFWNTNYYVVRDTYPDKYFLIPWDFDYSLGQSRYTFKSPEKNEESEIIERNILYKRLLNNTEFRDACDDRWNELRNTVWEKDDIIDALEDQYEDIEEAIVIEYEKWHEDLEYEPDEFTDELFDWIPDRIDYCDSYFNR